MRAYISIDMEGIAGVATGNQVRRGTDDYPRARALMTREANAAIEGAVEGGAAQVVVNDAHGDMANLLPDELDPRAELVIGSPKVRHSMLEGIDQTFDVALFVGYHAGTGVEGGVLAHTYSGAAFHDVRLDGSTVTETELNALVAGCYGVPVGLVTGDDHICRLVDERFPGTATVVVKRGHGSAVAASLHPQRACERIRDVAKTVVEQAGRLTPTTRQGPFTIEADLMRMHMAELCSLVPGVDQDGRTVRYTADDFLSAFQCLRAWMYLASSLE